MHQTATIPHLTLRQQAFLGLLALGASAPDLAAILHLTSSQVRAWQAHLCRALGCASCEELRAWVDGVPRGAVPSTGLMVHASGQVVWLEQADN